MPPTSRKQGGPANGKFSKLVWHRALCYRCLNLKYAEFKVLMRVFDYSDAEGRKAYASVERLMADTGLGKRTVERARGRLVEVGIVELVEENRHPNYGKANEYALRIPVCRCKTTDVDPGLHTGGTPVYSYTDPGLQTGSTDPDTQTLGTDPISSSSHDASIAADENPSDSFLASEGSRDVVPSESEGSARTATPDEFYQDFGVQAAYRKAGRKLDPHEMPGSWQPNYPNRVKAERLGLRLDWLADVFAAWAQCELLTDRNWCQRFGVLLHSIGEFGSPADGDNLHAIDTYVDWSPFEWGDWLNRFSLGCQGESPVIYGGAEIVPF